MSILLLIAAVILAVVIAGKINLSAKFSSEVKQLFAHSENISDRLFHKSQLEGLPEPVQRYFNRVLKKGQPYISYAGIKHRGQFKTGPDKGWTNIRGEQYATTTKPGFIWKGTTSLFVARDLYIADKGRLIVTLLYIFRVADGKGAKYNEGELLRWLGESVLYPTNLLPAERLQWSPIDENTARLTFRYREHALSFKITFNDSAEITEMETKRYMGERGLETWVIKISRYREMNNVRIPTLFEAIWRLETSDFSYAKFKITEVLYNRPERF